jgi:hypothetical protein
VGTVVTDSAQSIVLEPDARNVLTAALQPWLLAMSSLALVLLAGDGASARENASLNELRTTLDEIERLALASVRRTDMVVRCGFFCCALVLLDTGGEGAQCVVNRLRARLEESTTSRLPICIGLAAAPEDATEAEALIDRACGCSASLGVSEEAEHVPWKRSTYIDWPGASLIPQRGRASRRPVGATRRLNSALAIPAEPGRNLELRRSAKRPGTPKPIAAFAQARALALGVPYLAPPPCIPSSVRNVLPPEVMEQLQCLPVGRERNVLTVALADPTDQAVLRRLEQMTGMTIFPVMTDPDVLKDLARPARSRRSASTTTSTRRTSR